MKPRQHISKCPTVLASSLGALLAGFLTSTAQADFTLLLRDVTNTQVNSSTEAEAILALPAPDGTYTFTDTFASPDPAVIDVAGGGGSYGVNNPLPDGTTGTGKSDYILKATANIIIPAGNWSVGFGRDDGGYLRIDPEGSDGFPGFANEYSTNGDADPNDNTIRFNGTGGHNWTVGNFTLAAPLETSIEVVMFERGGGDSFEVAFATGLQTSHSTASWDLMEDTVNGWTVQVAPLTDTEPPVLAGVSPADDATGTYPGADLVATFDEEIALTGAGTITLTDVTNGTDTRTIHLPDPRVTVSGSELTIDPATNLAFSTEYEVSIDGLVLEDTWMPTANAYGGTASGEWTFTTAAADGTAPLLALVDPFSPADEATAVLLDTPLTVTFDEDILVNAGAGSVLFSEDFEAGGGTDGGFAPVGAPNDWARGTPNSNNDAGLVLTAGNNASANCWATNLTTGGVPSGTIDTAADSILRGPGDGVTPGSGIDLTGVATAQLQFAAAIDADDGDTVEILVKEVGSGDTLVTVPATELTPPVTADWATYGPYDISAAAGSEVYLEFRYVGTNNFYIGLYLDDIQVSGVDTANAVTLKDLSNATDTVIPISDSAQVSVTGNVLTITPASPLAPMASYAVQIGSTAIRNYNDLDFAGISDTTTWNFTTTGPMLLTWDPSGGGSSDGGGTWLGAGNWWNGSGNVDWGNSTPDSAVIGNGGGGGSISMGEVNAGTVLFDDFTGTYTLSGGSLDQDGGITIGSTAGNVTINSAVTGTGGLAVNGPSRVNLRGAAKPFTGDVVVGGGGEVLDDDFIGIGDGNLSLTDGSYVNYWSDTLTRTLGTGAGEVQVPGGVSGFTGQGASGLTVRFNNNSGFEAVWGSGLFNPSTFELQTEWANTNGKVVFDNAIDLNGATRTIRVSKDHGNLSGGNFYVDGYARMNRSIGNNDAGNVAGLVKEGPGMLILSATNTYDGGTTVNGGSVQYDRADAMPDSGTHTFNDGSELWVRVGGGGQFTAAGSGAGSLGGLLSGTGPGTSTTAFSGTVDLVLRPSGSPDYGGPLSMAGGTMGNLWIIDGSMTLSGTGSYTGETIIGRRGGSTITVSLGSSTAIATGSPVTIDTSGSSQLDLAGFDATIGLLRMGSNNGGARGQVIDTVGGGVLTLTDGVLSESHNNGNGGIYCDIVDLNGAPQTFTVQRANDADIDLEVTSVVRNGAVVLAGNNANAQMELSGACTYTGGTTVEEGNLIISGSLADSTMAIEPGSTVNGSGTLTFNVSGSTIDQIVMTGGTLDASGLTVNVSGTLTQAEYVLVDATGGGTISGTFLGLTGAPGYMLDYGTANQVKLVGTPGGSPYDTWAAGFAGLSDPSPGVDFDSGGLPTGVEWVVGGDPTDPADDAGLAPTIDTNSSPGNALVVFRQTDAAGADSNTTIGVEYSTDGEIWTPADPGNDGSSINLEEDGFDVGVDKVTVTLPGSFAFDGKLFARLSVVVATP